MNLKQIKQEITSQQLLGLLIFYSSFALIFAYSSQFFFDHQPCLLCLYQRIPFFAVILVSVVTLGFFRSEKAKKISLSLCVLILSINALLAFYHVGVERKIFAGPKNCATQNLDEIDSLEELRKAVLATKAVRCDKPSFVFLGLSMAAWNVIYCLFLVGSTIILLPRSAHEYPASKSHQN